MLAPASPSKFNNLLFSPTPAKLAVDCEINSWNETHSKQQVIYRYKHRKVLKAIEESQSKQTKKSSNLAQLRNYNQNLLKSSIKKLSEKTLLTLPSNKST
jgi:hypothetical protein